MGEVDEYYKELGEKKVRVELTREVWTKVLWAVRKSQEAVEDLVVKAVEAGLYTAVDGIRKEEEAWEEIYAAITKAIHEQAPESVEMAEKARKERIG